MEEEIDVKNTEKFLPIGTVVLLKGATKRLMISGYCAVDQEKKDEMWDYSGCMYPEGFLSSTQSFLFDHSQIAKIYSLGYKDDEEEEFQQKLNNYINSKKSDEDTVSGDSSEGEGSTPVSNEVDSASDVTESTSEEVKDISFNNQLLNNSDNIETVPGDAGLNNAEWSSNSEVDENSAPEESSVSGIDVANIPSSNDVSIDVDSIIAPNPEPATVPITANVSEPTADTSASDEVTSVEEVVGNVISQSTDTSTDEGGNADSNPSTAPNPNNVGDLSEFDQWLNQTGPYANNNNNNNQ